MKRYSVILAVSLFTSILLVGCTKKEAASEQTPPATTDTMQEEMGGAEAAAKTGEMEEAPAQEGSGDMVEPMESSEEPVTEETQCPPDDKECAKNQQ